MPTRFAFSPAMLSPARHRQSWAMIVV